MATKLSTYQQKVDWLLAHQEAWERFPTSLWQQGGYGFYLWRLLVVMMKGEGLLAKRTRWSQVRIPAMIADARKQRREVKAGRAALAKARGEQ